MQDVVLVQPEGDAYLLVALNVRAKVRRGRAGGDMHSMVNCRVSIDILSI
jgi:hypothetical protein